MCPPDRADTKRWSCSRKAAVPSRASNGPGTDTAASHSLQFQTLASVVQLHALRQSRYRKWHDILLERSRYRCSLAFAMPLRPAYVWKEPIGTLRYSDSRNGVDAETNRGSKRRSLYDLLLLECGNRRWRRYPPCDSRLRYTQSKSLLADLRSGSRR